MIYNINKEVMSPLYNKRIKYNLTFNKRESIIFFQTIFLFIFFNNDFFSKSASEETKLRVLECCLF